PTQNVSFGVGRGEIVGLAGLVGAGRTEVAQALFGIDGVIEAKVKLDQHELQIGSPQDAIKYGIYLVPEDRRNAGLIIEIPIRENVALASWELYSRSGLIAFERERLAATDICKKMNVKAPSVEERVVNLSGGNQQKV